MCWYHRQQRHAFAFCALLLFGISDALLNAQSFVSIQNNFRLWASRSAPFRNSQNTLSKINSSPSSPKPVLSKKSGRYKDEISSTRTTTAAITTAETCGLVLEDIPAYSSPLLLPLKASTSQENKEILVGNMMRMQEADNAMSDEKSGAKDSSLSNGPENSNSSSDIDNNSDPDCSGESQKRQDCSNVSSQEENKIQDIRKLVSGAALLGQKSSRSFSSSMSPRNEKKTSVGARRIGSASRERAQPGSASKILDVLRNAARGAAVGDDSPEEKRCGGVTDEEDGGSDDENTPFSGVARSIENKINSCNHISTSDGTIVNSPTKIKLSSSVIHAAIGELLHNNFAKTGNTNAQHGRFRSAVSSFKKRVASLGGSALDISAPFTSLAYSPDGLMARVATPMDDVDIANLRLSVFSDVTLEQRGQFCMQSCQAIASRRKLGAVCIVATKQGMVQEDEQEVANQSFARALPRICGTAECSYHEFYGTQLGQRRPRSSILHVTEVAVHPAMRRKGVGSLLLDAVDCFADRRRIETVYLHVDVCNYGAISLYTKCGYQKVDASEPIFQEFTKSLDLHPGATKGRSHYLLFKDISQATWLPQDMFFGEPRRAVGILGFEIPA